MDSGKDRRVEYSWEPQRPIPDDGPDDGHAIVSIIVVVAIAISAAAYYYFSRV